MEHLDIIEGPIPVHTYRHLRAVCGLSEKTAQASAIGLPRSIHAVMVKKGADIIGMGRIVGDGGCFCQIVDICVHPTHQGKGIGKMLMQNLSDFIQHNLPESCYISLIADGDAAYLYEQFGFQDTLPASKAMFVKR